MNLAFYAVVSQRANLRCEYCHAPAVIFNFGHEIDRILPLSKGGTDDLDNLALACRACNSCKHDFQSGIDAATNEETPLFHPRRDLWTNHFAVNAEGILNGLTGVGRATIARLRLNTPSQVGARQQWARLGLWP